MGQWFTQPDHTGISSAALFGAETHHAPRVAPARTGTSYGASAVADDPTTRQVLGLLRRTLDSLPE